MIFLNIILVIVGIALILWGADRLTDGASGLARKFHVTEAVIGLTVVAFGTSLPEFVVSLTSSLKGIPDMSIGNIVGSNVFNALVIVGASALVRPIVASRNTMFRDVPLMLIASLALVFLGYDQIFGNGDNCLTHGDGITLVLIFIIFMAYAFSQAKDDKAPQDVVEQMPIWKIALYIVLGSGCLVGGGKLLVENASQLALTMHISERVVGLTIVAAGTSLPEFATSLIAAKKGSQDMAIGNAIGSNLFNILFVLGCCSSITPMPAGGLNPLDASMLVGSCLILWLFTVTKATIQRWEGLVMCGIYISYLVFILL